MVHEDYIFSFKKPTGVFPQVGLLTSFQITMTILAMVTHGRFERPTP